MDYKPQSQHQPLNKSKNIKRISPPKIKRDNDTQSLDMNNNEQNQDPSVQQSQKGSQVSMHQKSLNLAKKETQLQQNKPLSPSITHKSTNINKNPPQYPQINTKNDSPFSNCKDINRAKNLTSESNKNNGKYIVYIINIIINALSRKIAPIIIYSSNT